MVCIENEFIWHQCYITLSVKEQTKMDYSAVDTHEMENTWQDKNLQSVREIILSCPITLEAEYHH